MNFKNYLFKEEEIDCEKLLNNINKLEHQVNFQNHGRSENEYQLFVNKLNFLKEKYNTYCLGYEYLINLINDTNIYGNDVINTIIKLLSNNPQKNFIINKLLEYIKTQLLKSSFYTYDRLKIIETGLLGMLY